MRPRSLIIILFFLWWGFDASAQVPDELSSMPEQWQLTLDVIKSKAQTLLVENNGLQVEYRQLVEQAQKLQQSTEGQQAKNEEMERFLNERHGRTDQQLRIDELTQDIKLKGQQPHAGRTVRQPQLGDQLPQLRKQLEDETRQEVLLENELEDLKTGRPQDNTRRYDQLKERKAQLESDIYAYESRLDGLRQSSLMALSWPLEKKKLVHEMVRVDARNNKMQDQIKALHEDIDVLKDQVAKLERRVNFSQGKDAQQ